MKKKLFILTIISIVILVGIFSFFYTRKQQSTSSQPAPSPEPTISFENLRNLPIPPERNMASTIHFFLSFTPTITPPPTMNTYTISPASAFDAGSLASTLGFSSTPVIFKTKSSTRLSWNNNSASFSYTDIPPSVSFSDNSVPTGVPVTIQTATTTFQEFIRKNNLLSPTFPLIYEDGHINSNADGSVANSAVAFLGFRYSVEQIPVYRQDSGLAGASVQVGQGNKISSFFMSLPASITKKDALPSATIDVALLGLNNNKGIFSSITKNRQNSENDIVVDKNFSEVSLDTVSLIYLWSSSDNLLIPAYRFTGTVTKGNDDSVNASVVYFIAATE